MKITQGSIVRLDYELRVKGGDVIESSARTGPLQYVQGEGKLLPAAREAAHRPRGGREARGGDPRGRSRAGGGHAPDAQDPAQGVPRGRPRGRRHLRGAHAHGRDDQPPHPRGDRGARERAPAPAPRGQGPALQGAGRHDRRPRQPPARARPQEAAAAPAERAQGREEGLSPAPPRLRSARARRRAGPRACGRARRASGGCSTPGSSPCPRPCRASRRSRGCSSRAR